jgi:hypothetical protein
MPSKEIYKIVFNEENKNYEILVTDEFGNPQTGYKFEQSAAIEDARRLMETLKEKIHGETEQNPYQEVVYVSPDHFETINHRD